LDALLPLNSHCSHRYSGTTVATAVAVRVQRNTFVRTYTRYSHHYSGTAVAVPRTASGTLSYARTPAIAAALGTAIAATMVTAIADGDLLHGWVKTFLLTGCGWWSAADYTRYFLPNSNSTRWLFAYLKHSITKEKYCSRPQS